jgi:hypothetical protein
VIDKRPVGLWYSPETRAHVLVVAPSAIGHRYLARGADQQLGAEMTFELGNLPAHRRKRHGQGERHGQGARGGRKTPRIDHGDKDAHGAKAVHLNTPYIEIVLL